MMRRSLGFAVCRGLATVFGATLLSAGGVSAKDVVSGFETGVLERCLPAILANRAVDTDGLVALSAVEKQEHTGGTPHDVYYLQDKQPDALLVVRGPGNCEVAAIGGVQSSLRDFPERHLVSDNAPFYELPDMPEGNRMFTMREGASVMFAFSPELTIFTGRSEAP